MSKINHAELENIINFINGLSDAELDQMSQSKLDIIMDMTGEFCTNVHGADLSLGTTIFDSAELSDVKEMDVQELRAFLLKNAKDLTKLVPDHSMFGYDHSVGDEVDITNPDLL